MCYANSFRHVYHPFFKIGWHTQQTIQEQMFSKNYTEQMFTCQHKKTIYREKINKISIYCENQNKNCKNRKR